MLFSAHTHGLSIPWSCTYVHAVNSVLLLSRSNLHPPPRVNGRHYQVKHQIVNYIVLYICCMLVQYDLELLQYLLDTKASLLFKCLSFYKRFNGSMLYCYVVYDYSVCKIKDCCRKCCENVIKTIVIFCFLFRWSEDGRLPYKKAATLLDKTMHFQQYDSGTFTVSVSITSLWWIGFGTNVNWNHLYPNLTVKHA